MNAPRPYAHLENSVTTLRLIPSSTVFSPAAPASNGRRWWETGIIYEVYPRSFQDTNGDGVGDLAGIRQRLPYLRDLGVDAIWITPFFRSPMADFGYDVADYCDVDPVFGTMADFDAMLHDAHAMGIRVIVDFVPNHTSSQHPWFLESRSSRDNPKRNWYIWHEGRTDDHGNRLPPNNWETFFGGSAWTFDDATGQYYLHMFLEQQPDLNWRTPEVVAAMQDVLHFWLRKGVDGFRLDAITILIKHDEFPDMPDDEDDTLYGGDLLLRLVDVHNQPELHPILRGFRAITDSYSGDRVLIAETGAADFEELMEFCGSELNEIQLPMNLNTMLLPWSANTMRQSIEAYYAALHPGATPNFVFGNHDKSRFATRYGDENHRAINTMLLTLWGAPTLYYGDELGMPDGRILPEQQKDPFITRYSEFGLGRDPERTPMQWDDSPNGGFCSPHAEPWLPMFTRFPSSVAAQETDPTSTLNYCKQLIRLRRQFAALQDGSIRFIDTAEKSDEVLVYLRESHERILVAINFGGASRVIDVSALSGHASPLLSSRLDTPQMLSASSVELRPYESLLLSLT
ncbi:MAG: alpha-amylase family glycosyl hydrolase [Anaerolineae bacterium]